MTREAGSSDSVGGSCGQVLGKCSEIMSHPRQAIIFKSGELKRRSESQKKGRRLLISLALKVTALHAETDRQ